MNHFDTMHEMFEFFGIEDGRAIEIMKESYTTLRKCKNPKKAMKKLKLENTGEIGFTSFIFASQIFLLNAREVAKKMKEEKNEKPNYIG